MRTEGARDNRLVAVATFKVDDSRIAMFPLIPSSGVAHAGIRSFSSHGVLVEWCNRKWADMPTIGYPECRTGKGYISA